MTLIVMKPIRRGYTRINADQNQDPHNSFLISAAPRPRRLGGFYSIRVYPR